MKMFLFIVLCLSICFVNSEARSQPGPVLTPVCPSGWNKCSSGSECSETSCCGRLNMYPLPEGRCCVPRQYIYAFKPQNLCVEEDIRKPDIAGPGSCPPLNVPSRNLGLGFGCPKEDYKEECTSHDDCKRSYEVQLCCPYSRVAGCVAGKKCTSAVQISP